jgi:hypothetical protein
VTPPGASSCLMRRASSAPLLLPNGRFARRAGREARGPRPALAITNLSSEKIAMTNAHDRSSRIPRRSGTSSGPFAHARRPLQGQEANSDSGPGAPRRTATSCPRPQQQFATLRHTPATMPGETLWARLPKSDSAPQPPPCGAFFRPGRYRVSNKAQRGRRDK